MQSVIRTAKLKARYPMSLITMTRFSRSVSGVGKNLGKG